MFKRLLILLFTVLVFVNPIVMADITATVDKTEIVYGENINLTIDSDSSDSPDLEPLKNLFNIMGIQQGQQVNIINGKKTSFYQWVITLAPIQKSNGIIIPPITAGKQETKPLTIKIIDTPTTVTSLTGKEILKAKISVNKPALYIQQQEILTLYIYASPDVLRVNNLIVPTVSDVNVEQLKDRNYTREINGILYTVVERRYAFSPQKSGKLKIPSFALSAIIQENGHTLQKTVVSNELTIQVKPKPTNYPNNTPWLPAKNIKINEVWSKSLTNVLQGDTLTRTLDITVEGLTSKQLGSLPNPTIIGLRNYPSQPKLKTDWQQDTPIGHRQEQTVFIPIQTGKITIPEIKVAWWNVDTDQLEYATVAAQTIKVEPNPTFNNTSLTGNASANNTNPPAIIKKIDSPTLWLWQLATIILTFTTVIFFALWAYARKQPAIIKEPTPVINPKTLLDDIKKACSDNDPQTTRIALDNWAKQQPDNLTELMSRYTPLSEAIEELNTVLYSEVSQTWNGTKLWQAVQTLPKKEVIANTNNSLLPPLYPK